MNSIVTVAVVLAAWIAFRWTIVRRQRIWRRTKPGQEWRLYKARLPGWVRPTEMLFWSIFWVFFTLVADVVIDVVYLHVHPGRMDIDGLANGLIIAASVFGALGPALLLGNGVSWLVPPLRKVNRAAMAGLETVSYGAASLGLAKFAAVMIPIAAVLAALAIYAPWGK